MQQKTFVTLPLEVVENALSALENTSPLGFNMESDKKFYAAITDLLTVIQKSQCECNIVAEISGIDEYGPMINWYKHWTTFELGTKLYVYPHQ